jgi:hypothetical protein
MRPPVNRWRLAGVVLNFVGTMVLLVYSGQVLSLTPAYELQITFDTWATSPWWWYRGLGLNILGFLCQLISNFCGGERRAPPPAGTAQEALSPAASLPSMVANDRPDCPPETPPLDDRTL